jgi:hypothetical protein
LFVNWTNVTNNKEKEMKIPTFKPGTKVIIHNHPVEFVCPHCGHIAGSSTSPCEMEGIVIGQCNLANCSECYSIIKFPEGWYKVKSDELDKRFVDENPNNRHIPHKFWCIPYTLLEEKYNEAIQHFTEE